MSLSQITGYQITRAHLVCLDHYEKAVGQPFDLRKVEYTVLQLLREGLCTTPGQLAKELQMTAPSISVWLDKLDARGLLKRSKSSIDGRTQQLELTAKGLRLMGQAHEKLLASELSMLAPLSIGERTMLLEILQKLSKNSHSPA